MAAEGNDKWVTASPASLDHMSMVEMYFNEKLKTAELTPNPLK